MRWLVAAVLLCAFYFSMAKSKTKLKRRKKLKKKKRVRAQTGAFSYEKRGRIGENLRDRMMLGMGLAAMMSEKESINYQK